MLLEAKQPRGTSSDEAYAMDALNPILTSRLFCWLSNAACLHSDSSVMYDSHLLDDSNIGPPPP